MKNITKIFAAVLAVAMLLSLAACGTSKGSDTDVPEDSAEPTALIGGELGVGGQAPHVHQRSLPSV